MRYTAFAAIALICTSLPAQTSSTKPEFEVASVRPTVDLKGNSHLSQIMREAGRNDRHPGEIPMTGPDRVQLKNWALVDLIAAAYSVRPSQVSGPTWLSDQVFDVEATVLVGTPKEELNGMLQWLLEERFGVEVHRGTQTGQGFALVVGKDGFKLKRAEPPPQPPTEAPTEEERKDQMDKRMKASMAAMRKREQENVGSSGASSAESWPSISMGELAAQLTRLAEAPVIDETGLTGNYSVSIKTAKSLDGPETTVFDAVEKLGLKLEPRKVTITTVVVDQVSRTPTAN